MPLTKVQQKYTETFYVYPFCYPYSFSKETSNFVSREELQSGPNGPALQHSGDVVLTIHM